MSQHQIDAAAWRKALKSAAARIRDPRLPRSDDDLAELARSLWSLLFPRKPWPRTLTIGWVWNAKEAVSSRQARELSETAGLYTDSGRGQRIWLSYRNLRFPTPGYSRDAENVLHTLIHELMHARYPELGHHPPFEALVKAATARVWRACA